MDTEGDNLWAWKPGAPITTENTKFLPRFQKLCERFGFKPVWLTNYEMISDPCYVEFISGVEQTGTGELGMHLHAWNNPPEYDLPIVQAGAPYLIEYPVETMDAKIAVLTQKIKDTTGTTPVSHRAGRWAMNEKYFDLLGKYGYKVDCSVTPKINWSSACGQSKGAVGSDYSGYPDRPYVIETAGAQKLLEVPVTIMDSHRIFMPEQMSMRSIAGAAYRAIKGQKLWIRPTGRNLKQMLYLADTVAESDADYLMFMLHSSELMPAGSPTFRTEGQIEKLYADMEKLFLHISRKFEGATLRDMQVFEC